MMDAMDNSTLNDIINIEEDNSNSAKKMQDGSCRGLRNFEIEDIDG
jgi:hypothetical protein